MFLCDILSDSLGEGCCAKSRFSPFKPKPWQMQNTSGQNIKILFCQEHSRTVLSFVIDACWALYVFYINKDKSEACGFGIFKWTFWLPPSHTLLHFPLFLISNYSVSLLLFMTAGIRNMSTNCLIEGQDCQAFSKYFFTLCISS